MKRTILLSLVAQYILLSTTITGSEQKVVEPGQYIEVHAHDVIEIENSNVTFQLEGIGNEHHTDGTVVDNAKFTATKEDKVESLFLEVVDGRSAMANVFDLVLTLKSCSAHHKICTVMIEKLEL